MKTARCIVPNSVAERQTPSMWDVTVANTLAGSYVDTATTGAGLVADQAADRKTAKYADLRAQYVFQPVSVENLGPFSSSTLDFLRDLGRRISHISGDDREVLFLFQRISVTIQRFNSVLLHDSFILLLFLFNITLLMLVPCPVETEGLRLGASN